MKRIGNLFSRVCSLENLQAADRLARQGKRNQYGVKKFDRNSEANLHELRDMLLQKEYSTSLYVIKTIKDPKEREVYKLPYYPDRIVHHAIMLQMEPILVGCFTRDSYASIKGRGVHAALDALGRSLKDAAGTQYCLKLDVRKFYQTIDHDIMKALLRRKIKDADLLWLLDEIIDSAPGIPIGNYLSGFFANLYLNGLDHYLKEVLRVKYYFRYMDDIVILGSVKPYLHEIFAQIRKYLFDHLKLEVKNNYQVFPVAARGIDFLGYVKYHTHTRLRKRNKISFARAVASCKSMASIASHYGWATHANSNHLLKKLLYQNEKFQRIQHNADRKSFRRKKYRDRRDPEPGDNCRGLQDRSIEISGTVRQVPHPADKIRGQATGNILGIQNTHGSNREGPPQ